MLHLVAGVNTGRDAAYTRMVDRGFRTEITGVLMHKPNDAAYNLSDVFVLDDWHQSKLSLGDRRKFFTKTVEFSE
ncbi:hypothetical protein QT971_13290 [Microcoleus sp. herbarium19]